MNKGDAHWADQLLERARATAAPREEDAARNLASIEARLGIGPGMATDVARDVAPGGTPSAGGAASGARIGSAAKGALFKGGLVLAFGVGTGVIGYLIGRAETERSRDAIADTAVAAPVAPASAAATPDGRARVAFAESTADAATAPAPVIAVAPAAPAARRPAARAAAVHRPRDARLAAVSASNRADVFGLSDALELLRRAEAAVRRSDGLEARMWLSDLDRRAPPQLLLEERLVTRALSDCLVGDVDAARVTRRELEASNPESIYRARLEGSCVADRMR